MKAGPGVVAVTGGARGIGEATARRLAAAGASVGIGDLDIERAERVAGALPSARAYALDVADRSSFRAFLDGVEADLGPVDALVNNAGVMAVGRFCDERDDDTVRQIDTNLLGVMYGCKEVVPRLLARGRGHIVNVASTMARAPMGGAATYSATKHAVLGLSRALRQELRGTDVHVSVLLLYAVDTPLADGLALPRFSPRPRSVDEAAAAVAAVLRRPRRERWVPRWLAPLMALERVMPERLRAEVPTFRRADRVFLDADADRRRAYEEKAFTRR